MSAFTEGFIIFVIEMMFLFSFGIACFIVVAVMMNICWCIGWIVSKVYEIWEKSTTQK